MNNLTQVILRSDLNNLEELKFICQFPRFFISNYFSDLKSQVDYLYESQNRNDLMREEIIKKLEEIEDDFLRKIKNKKLNTNHLDVLENNVRSSTISDLELIDQIEIEEIKIYKEIFRGQTVFFLKQNESHHDFFNNNNNIGRLVIIKNVSMSKNDILYFTNRELYTNAKK